MMPFTGSARRRGCRFWPRSLTTGPSPRPTARGRIIADSIPGLQETFVSLRDKIRDLAKPSRPREAAHA